MNIGDVFVTTPAFESLGPRQYVLDLVLAYWAQRLNLARQTKDVVEFVAPSLVQLMRMVPDADVIRDAVGRAIVQCPPRFLVLPVNDSTDLTAHISGSHWAVVACDLKRRTCFYYDSVGRASSQNIQAARAVVRSIASIYQWDQGAEFVVAEVSQQKNAYDCGIYAMLVMENIQEALKQTVDPVELSLPTRILIDERASSQMRTRVANLLVGSYCMQHQESTVQDLRAKFAATSAWSGHRAHTLDVLSTALVSAKNSRSKGLLFKYSILAISEYMSWLGGEGDRLGAISLPESILRCGSDDKLKTIHDYVASELLVQDQPQDYYHIVRHCDGIYYHLIQYELESSTTTTADAERTGLPLLGQTIEATCPVRIDLAGGWSDTPPLSYDFGGAVINLALRLDDRRPVGAQVTRISECVLELVLQGINSPNIITVRSFEDLANYNNPMVPGALLKAAFIAIGIVPLDLVTAGLPNAPTLQDHLRATYDGGFRVFTWAHLPQGSGLGTSSILAGALLAALARACGSVDVDLDRLVYKVLQLEQLLTTGGGWQDQVGGMYPGAKIARSPAQLPLQVVTTPLGGALFLEDHILLIYTGQTRLARDLLQSVLRRWALQQPGIVENVRNLVANAEVCAKAFERRDVEALGKCVEHYRVQKKLMAGDMCEPAHVTKIMDALKPHVWGQAMAGAGGGGFMYCITKQAGVQAELEATVRSALAGSGFESVVTFHRARIDLDGLVVTQLS